MNRVQHFNMQFYSIGTEYDFIEADVHVKPGYSTQVICSKKIEPSSPEYWGMALRAGYVHFQFKQGLQLAEFKYRLYENKKNKPRKPREPTRN